MPSKACKDCFVKLGFFRKKFKCRQCKCDYCEPCFSKVKDHKLELCDKLMHNDNIHSCLKCVVFSTKNFQRGNLFLLETKQLSEYLNERHISTTHCREKYDLIDLIMEFAEVHGFKSVADIEHDMIHRSKVEELRRAEVIRQMEERAHNSQDNENDPVAPIDELTLRPNFNWNIDTPYPIIVVSNNGSNEVPNRSDYEEDNFHERNSNIGNNMSDIRDAPTVNNSATNCSSFEENVTPQQVRFNQSYGKWRSMDDIKDENDIGNLSVIELKQVLKANFIDYRGCCEKKELMDKVILLYNSQKKDTTICNENERDLCKICMDHIIDCVLLDCGHLVSCTKCGKRLAECPICRALVVRVVHIFRV